MFLLSFLGNVNTGFSLGFSAIFIYQLELEQELTVNDKSLIGKSVFLYPFLENKVVHSFV